MSKVPRTDVIALLALGAAAALGIGLLILRSGASSKNPLEAVPADSFMVMSIDVVALADSPLGASLVGELKGEGAARATALLGVDSIEATCGFDPLPHLRQIAVAYPEGGERGDFGIAVSGTLAKDALATCAKAVIAKRGGDPTSRQAGSFTVIADGRTPGGGEVAFRDGGPYLVGHGVWLERMIDAADGRIPSTLAATESAHAALRADLRARDTDAEAIRLTALLPRPIRERVQAEMARESGGASDTMQGVLGVSAAAFGIHAGRAHEDSRFVAELRCDTKAACEAVSSLIRQTRLHLSENLGYRLFGLGPLIDNLEVQPGGSEAHPSVHVHTRAPADDLAKILDRVLHPASRKPAATTPDNPPPPR